jgi:hypothetical protein
MIAPLPGSDASESPYELVAIILAKMLDPHGKLKGLVISVAIGI